MQGAWCHGQRGRPAPPIPFAAGHHRAKTPTISSARRGELALAQACVHMACAPKSNASTPPSAPPAARPETGSLMPPAIIRNAPPA